MKRKKRILGVLMIAAALMIMQLPKAEADAATSASDFKMEGSKLVRYRGSEKNVSVPDTVSTIGQGAFEENSNIELVVVPNSVKSIEPYAFWGCSSLDTVVLGKGLSEISGYAFANCTGLKQISIPSNVTSIGVQAFVDCVNLTDITIPPETTDINETAFDGCYRLTIHYEKGSAAEKYAESFYERQKEMPEYEDVPDYGVSDLINDIISPEPPTETEAPAETPAPTQEPAAETGPVLGSTQIVGNRAVVMFNNTQVNVYGAEPPEGTEAPVSPADGTEDGAGNSEIIKYTVVDNKIVADQAYYRNTELGDVALADGITEVGQFSFARSSMTSVSLPQGVEKIGYGAFYHCDRLEEVTLPDSIMCVEPKAFSRSLWVDNFLKGETDAADTQKGDFLISGGVLAAYRGNQPEVKVPEGVRVIAGEVFQGHEEIESVSLPDSLLVVGEGAFEGCSQLAEISFGKNVREIKDRAFLGNSIREIPLPASVEKLGLQAFGNTIISYAGKEAERTYEPSAARLSNEAYRVYSGMDTEEPGVTVTGLDGASASLEGAARRYTLAVTEPEDVSAMEKAFERSFHTAPPGDMVFYDMTLTDESGIPLEKLGSQALEAILPVPETLRGQELRLFTLDRNGQLEELDVGRVLADGVESFRFRTDHLSLFGLYGTGPAGDEELLEMEENSEPLSAAPAGTVHKLTKLRMPISVILTAGGIGLILASFRRKRS